MNSQSRTFFATRLTRGTLGLLLLLVFALPFYSCNDDNDETATEGDATLGSLTISVTPATAEVLIEGPNGFSQTITGSLCISDLEPGEYTASATASGFSDADGSITIVAGETSSLTLSLLSTTSAPTATLGSLNINVTPATASVVMAGPDSYSKTFTGNLFIADLKPGQYTASATASGFSNAVSQINVVAGHTSSISLLLLDTTTATAATLGALNINVTPATASVVMAGPNSYSKTFTGNQFLVDLKPGQYTATATASGFNNAAAQINVVVGQTSSLSLLLLDTPTAAAALGALNININPASATVLVTGPNDFELSFTGNRLLIDLKPGEYRAVASAPGFGDSTMGINVVVGMTSSLSFVLPAKPIITEAPRAVYRDNNGSLVRFDSIVMQSGQFSFHAWLEDNPEGIVPSHITTSPISNPGNPLLSEQKEYAPSFTQNLAGAWVGFKDAGGIVRPVIGADVRWELDQLWSKRVNSMQFGTSDDNRIAQGFGVFDDQADTRTNNARLTGERFPYVASEYPLYNVTGIAAPYADGFTWVTLFSPDTRAAGRIVAVATVNGEEIGKQILYKNFAPAPKLTITKTVSADVVNLVAGSATVTWTVKVKNVGLGEATNVDLSDILLSGVGTNYSLGPLPAGSTAVGDGFTLSFPLPSGDTETLTFTATVTEAGTYCNEAQVLEYNDDDNEWEPIGLKASDCFTALESKVSIIKDFVADDNTTSLGRAKTVSANVPAKLRVRVINNGSGNATGVAVNDVLSSGDGTKYAASSFSLGTANSTDGFDYTIADLAAGATTTMLFTVVGSADGVYCDTVTVTATSGDIGIGTDTACLTVATPNLTITKTDAPESVIPGDTYVSTIVVTNTGNATATNVVISDVLGLNAEVSMRVIYVSSSLSGVGGILANNTVTANTMDIVAGQIVTFTVTSRIPLGAISGTYCDEATVTSSNTPTREASDCIDVPAFSALQTQMIDLNDPVAAGSELTFFSTMYVESLSNEGVNKNTMKFSFGLTNPEGIGTAGLFRVISTEVYLDTAPVRDPITGLVVSDATNATAVLQTAGSAYTIDNTTAGLQVITMTPGVALLPNTAIYCLHLVTIPSATPTNKMYTSSYIWNSVGLGDTSHLYQASSSEPTTVLP